MPHGNRSDPASVAYRRAWWSLALYPVSFVAAFAVGEGLISLFTGDPGHAALWQVLVAATPALVVFATPGVIGVILGRRAMRLGRADGKVPAVVGAVVAAGFVVLNAASYLAGSVVG